MKYTYFSPDKKYVIQFYNNPSDADLSIRSRLEAIIGKYNPTKSHKQGGAVGVDEKLAGYFSKRYCWPVDIVVQPEFGIVSPCYPSNFFFNQNSSRFLNLDGKDKKSNWFTSSNRRFLDKSELGDLRMWIQMSVLLARSVRRLHQAGLAHSDLSNNNVLIDPRTGNCIVIDIDSLVVPGIYPPEVAGTRGYIAPEVLATMELPRRDPRRVIPGSKTDLHALAVLIYEYLFFRNPLSGPKIFSSVSAEEDDFLGFGEKALFIEHPTDRSNRPRDLFPTVDDYGEILKNLFHRAFVEGLHNPELRPSALEWERGLTRTRDRLMMCQNPDCVYGWFIPKDFTNPVCPFCKTNGDRRSVIKFDFYTEVKGHPGQWRKYSEMTAAKDTPLFLWHIRPNVYADEKTDSDIMAYTAFTQNKWYLINNKIEGLISPKGSDVPFGTAFQMEDGDIFKTAQTGGIIIEVRL
jgi:serine/threonine protein kinase